MDHHSLGHDPPAERPPPLRPVLTLTEEELLVLTDGEHGVVPPRLQLPSDAEQAELVRTVALRSLMARGLVTPRADRDGSSQWGLVADRAPEAGTDEGEAVAWEATEPLGLTLTLRALAPAVLGLQRVLGPLCADASAGNRHEAEPTTAVRYLHLHPEIAVIEDVTPDGMHSLLTVLPQRYADAVADFIRPPEAVPGTGAAHRLEDTGDTAVADLLAALGHPTVLVEAATLCAPGVPVRGRDGPDGPVTQMLALGPGGCFRSPDAIVYHPVDPDVAIRELVQTALGVA